jgi:hypothetical protein
MQLTIDRQAGAKTGRNRPPKSGEESLHYAIGEINAYIAIRDELLAEAEELRTSAKLRSLAIANEFVESCLTPSQAPYQGQFLPEADAVRERGRCQDIKRRIAQLRPA